MCEGVASGKYDISVFANLQGAFDVVWRKGAQYKSHKAGITNNLLSVFSSFLIERFYGNVVDSSPAPLTGACSTTTDVPQGSIISPFHFLDFTADMTLEEPKQTSEIPTESKYADGFEFWRIGTDFCHLLI